ncbi:ankyrin repeat [Fusarium beomiforme]|uniref:Ankyrin repeat n=1 Tax=Fusarium beomiforme TaxID=44412 RepID=A0A9P5DXV6_9HYPO|nr:ankyrin repeat [Fusarium beomiforme]
MTSMNRKSPKSYIRKIIINWKFRKNSTKEEWELASSLITQRQAEGKSTELVIHGADPNPVHPEHLSALHESVAHGDLAIVDVLIEAGAGPDAFCRVEAVRALKRANPEKWGLRNKYHNLVVTPLQSAVSKDKGVASIVQRLLRVGADPDGTPYPEFQGNTEELSWKGDFPRSALQIASEKGNFEVVEVLLRAGTNANFQQTMHPTALQSACAIFENKKSTRVAELLLEDGADVNVPPGPEVAKVLWKLPRHIKGSYGIISTSINVMVLIVDSHEELVKSLFSHFSKTGPLAADIVERRKTDDIRVTSSFGDLEFYDMLLQPRIDANSRSYEEIVLNAMESAASLGSRGTLYRLLKCGVNPNVDGRACRILNKAISNESSECFNLLISNYTSLDIDLDDCLPDDSAPLLTALAYDQRAMAQCLILDGVNVNKPSLDRRGKKTQLPLSNVIDCGRCLYFDFSEQHDVMFLVDILIDAGADINQLDGSRTALLLALKNGLKYTAETLLLNGTDPNVKDLTIGMSSFSLALKGCEGLQNIECSLFEFLLYHDLDLDVIVRIASLLLTAGAEVNAPATEGSPMTALQYAINDDFRELIDLFLAAGADIHTPAFWYKGKTALQAACTWGNEGLVRSFIAQGVDINAGPATQYGATALQFAALQGHINIVLLLGHGALINAPAASVGGRTALQGATEHGRLDMIYLLLENDHDDGLEERCQDAAKFTEAESKFEIARLLRE